MRSFLAGLISVYQKIGFFPPRCRYLPTCSEYMRQALLGHGVLRGLPLGVLRILRCHPWKAGGMDPVPMEIEKKAVSRQ